MTTFIPYKPLSEKWLKASVIGSLWAVVEIVLGSLLHNLKIPFAGSILSFFTVYLIIAFFQLWKLDGVIWRAGLICALMKSLAPSSIILGPMLGIFSEALILEIIIRSFGKNIFAYGIGGALTVFSALIHKTISLLILYGWDFVTILKNIYLYAANQLKITKLEPVSILIIVAAIYLTIGCLAGILGYISGQQFLKQNHSENSPLIKGNAGSDLFKYSSTQNHSSLLLLLIIPMLIAGMIIISQTNILISTAFTLLFLVSISLRYKQNMRFLKKRAIWIQLSLILLFSAIFYDGFSINGILEPEGWIVGWKMVFRAMILLAAFSAISRELQSPIVKNILYRRGLKNLYQSLELSFSALPELVEAFANDTSKLFGFKKLTHTMLNNSQSLLENFVTIESNKPTVFILSGKVNEGKTTLAKKVISDLQNRGIHIQGFFSIATDNLEKKSYYVEDITTGSKGILCSSQPAKGNIKSGRFYFSEEGLNHGLHVLEKALLQPNQLTVIDEIGPLEINDKGWTPAIPPLLNQPRSTHLWVVRERLVNVVIRKWSVGNVYVFNLKEDSIDEIATCIYKNMKAK